MMHCAINSTQSVCWEDGQAGTYPGFAPTFTADWDGISPFLTNCVGTIPAVMPFAGWPAMNQATWQASQPPVI